MKRKTKKYLIKDILPLEVNHCYGYNRYTGRKFLYPKARSYKEDLIEEFRKTVPINPAEFYSVSIVIYIPKEVFYLKDGKTLRKANDASNFIKLIEDAYFEYINDSDAKNLYVGVYKRPSFDSKWAIGFVISEDSLSSPLIAHKIELNKSNSSVLVSYYE